MLTGKLQAYPLPYQKILAIGQQQNERIKSEWAEPRVYLSWFPMAELVPKSYCSNVWVGSFNFVSFGSLLATFPSHFVETWDCLQWKLGVGYCSYYVYIIIKNNIKKCLFINFVSMLRVGLADIFSRLSSNIQPDWWIITRFYPLQLSKIGFLQSPIF